MPLGAEEADVQASEALAVGEVEKSNLEQDKQAEKRKKATTSHPRMVFPEELPHEEQVIDSEGVSEEEYKVIGEEVTEVLVMGPASFKVKRIIRRKWALKDPLKSDKKGVLIAPIPSRTIQRGLFDESVLAYLLTSKFVDHLPPYRQRKIFERIGIKIPPSTLTDNTNAACKALLPIYNALKRETLANLYLRWMRPDCRYWKVARMDPPTGDTCGPITHQWMGWCSLIIGQAGIAPVRKRY